MATTLPSCDALELLDDATLSALHECFASSGYDGALIGRIESLLPGAFDAFSLPLTRLALRTMGTPAGTLARLFSYDDTVHDDDTRAALGSHLVEALERAGVLRREGNGWRAPWRITPFEELWILSDELSAGGDAVMGPGPTTAIVASLMPAPIPERVLDVGCGAGTFALLAAMRGAARAVGVDLNERAIVLARFNARFNKVEAHFASGDLYAPAGHERFDLVVSQPPFVMAPPDVAKATFLHGGSTGDELALRVIAEAPASLAPNGVAVVLLDAPVYANAPFHVRARNALGAANVDLVVMHSPGHSLDMHSVAYAAMAHPRLDERYASEVVSYRNHLTSIGVSELQRLLVLVRAPVEGRARGFNVTTPMRTGSRPDAHWIRNMFRVLDLLSAGEAALLNARLAIAPGARFVDERNTPDRRVAPRITVHFDRRNPAIDRELDEDSLALLDIAAGGGTVAEVIGDFAALCETSFDDVKGQVLNFVRDSLVRGLVVLRDVE